MLNPMKLISGQSSISSFIILVLQAFASSSLFSQTACQPIDMCIPFARMSMMSRTPLTIQI